MPTRYNFSVSIWLCGRGPSEITVISCPKLAKPIANLTRFRSAPPGSNSVITSDIFMLVTVFLNNLPCLYTVSATRLFNQCQNNQCMASCMLLSRSHDIDVMFDLSDYHYDLPPELIAQQPLKERTDARMMVVNRTSGCISNLHIVFY